MTTETVFSDEYQVVAVTNLGSVLGPLPFEVFAIGDDEEDSLGRAIEYARRKCQAAEKNGTFTYQVRRVTVSTIDFSRSGRC